MSIPVPADAEAVFRRYLSAVVLNGLAHADAAGLHPTDFYALNLLALTESMTAGALAGQTGLTTGATTRLIDRLERAGHARRTPDPADRRRIVVEAVPDPAFAAEDVFGPARRRLAEVFARFDAGQLDTIFEYFRQATDAFQKATEETRRAAADRAAG